MRLLVHERDCEIQFYCDEESRFGANALVLGLGEVRSHRDLMLDIPTVRPSYYVERPRLGETWTSHRIEK